jgi:hypothetical protein
MKDPNSRVSKLKALDRDYQVLDYLYTRPRLTYLAKVRNPNSSMPDATEYPLTTKEYTDTMHVHGNPYEEEAAAHGAENHSEAGHAEPATGGAKGSH